MIKPAYFLLVTCAFLPGLGQAQHRHVLACPFASKASECPASLPRSSTREHRADWDRPGNHLVSGKIQRDDHASNGARLPFRTVQSMILVEGQVNGNNVTFLLDTGCNHSVVSVRAYGRVSSHLHSVQPLSNGNGTVGETVRLPVDFRLANHIWGGQLISVMNLDELKRALGINFDGLLGQDILREFRRVHIDYQAHVIELEE